METDLLMHTDNTETTSTVEKAQLYQKAQEEMRNKQQGCCGLSEFNLLSNVVTFC